MKTIIFLLTAFTFFAANLLQAEQINVVDVKRNITLSDDENVYKDFYLNAGEGSGLKKNLVISVKRKVSVKDSGTKSIGDFNALVGQLKVIHVGSKVSVAREFKLISRDEEPMLEQIGIMSGDQVDLTGSFIDYTKPVYKRKTSELETPKKEDGIKTADASAVTTQTLQVQATTVTTEQKTEAPRDPASAANASSVGTTTEPPALFKKIIPMPGF